MGYIAKDRHYSMKRNLENYTYVNNSNYKLIKFDYSYSLELLEFLKNEFGGGWKRNALMAMRNHTAEEVILLMLDDNDKICGFSMSAIDGNPHRFGPIGISKDMRNKGLGTYLLNFALNHFKEKRIDYIFFMTTDEMGRRFYERNGFELIRTFTEYRKKIMN